MKYLKRYITILMIGLFVGLTIPVGAGHPPEPQNAITALEVNLFAYPDRSTILACDGNDVWDRDDMRVHVKLQYDKTYSAGRDPSEHFGASISVFKVTIKPNGDFTRSGFWETEWNHQNFGPHAKSDLAFKANIWNMDRHIGLWEVRVHIVGHESGNTFDSVCMFEKV